MTTFTNEEQEIRVKNLRMKIADLKKENQALTTDIKKLKGDAGRFYCKWCDTMKPIDDLAEIVTDEEYVTWVGCRDCHKKQMRLRQHAPS